jgi:hypothetical protein
MPKQTAKYTSACRKAESLKIPIGEHQEELYQALNAQGWYWNSQEKLWEKLDEEADPPTELIRVRIWADSRFVEQAANDCVEVLAKKGLRLIERSATFTCRPPKQLESRIYLAFQKEPENTDQPKSTDVILGGKKSER